MGKTPVLESIVDFVLASDASWADNMRRIRESNDKFIRDGYSPNDSCILGMVFGAGGLQFYIPKPKTLIHSPMLISSRIRNRLPEAK